MTTPGLDRILSSGYYGTATTRFIAIITNGWYDDVGSQIFPPFSIAVTVNTPAVGFAAKTPAPGFNTNTPAVKVATK